jgi:osmotically inducible lipoprotein OsmB
MKRAIFGSMLFASLLLVACSGAGRDTLLGAGAGAGAGAAIGHAVGGGTAEGAAIGGAVGAATGYGIHESKDDD